LRRLSLLLVSAVMALTLIAVAAGVAWAVTKDCPPHPQGCTGTSGNDVLNSSPEDNWMEGLAGNDTYTNFVQPKSGFDVIGDAAGTDKLVLTNYTADEVIFYTYDANEDGNVESIWIDIPPKDPADGSNNSVVVVNYWTDTQQECPSLDACDPGPGHIEAIQFAGGGGASLTGLKPR
jgi:hypothetical protein